MESKTLPPPPQLPDNQQLLQNIELARSACEDRANINEYLTEFDSSVQAPSIDHHHHSSLIHEAETEEDDCLLPVSSPEGRNEEPWKEDKPKRSRFDRPCMQDSPNTTPSHQTSNESTHTHALQLSPTRKDRSRTTTTTSNHEQNVGSSCQQQQQQQQQQQSSDIIKSKRKSSGNGSSRRDRDRDRGERDRDRDRDRERDVVDEFGRRENNGSGKLSLEETGRRKTRDMDDRHSRKRRSSRSRSRSPEQRRRRKSHSPAAALQRTSKSSPRRQRSQSPSPVREEKGKEKGGGDPWADHGIPKREIGRSRIQDAKNRSLHKSMGEESHPRVGNYSKQDSSNRGVDYYSTQWHDDNESPATHDNGSAQHITAAGVFEPEMAEPPNSSSNNNNDDIMLMMGDLPVGEEMLMEAVSPVTAAAAAAAPPPPPPLLPLPATAAVQGSGGGVISTGIAEEMKGDDGEEEGGEKSSSRKDKDMKASMLVRVAVTDYVKETLKPTWREGHMSKELYKTIAKKAVDKVVGALQSHQIPRNQDKVDRFMSASREKISKLVQGYVEKYLKS